MAGVAVNVRSVGRLFKARIEAAHPFADYGLRSTVPQKSANASRSERMHLPISGTLRSAP